MKNSPEDIENLWNTFNKFLLKSTKRSEKLVEVLGERIVMTPSSAREENGWSYPGGFLEKSISIMQLMIETSKNLDKSLDMKSICKVSLLHDLGNVGDLNNSLYLEQDSTWHLEQGINYKLNPKVKKMITSHRSLYLLQKLGIELTFDEWQAIFVSGGVHLEANKFYAKDLHALGNILVFSKRHVEFCRQSK